MVEEIINIKNMKVTIVKDSNNLVEIFKSLYPVQEKRLRVNFAALKKDMVDSFL